MASDTKAYRDSHKVPSGVSTSVYVQRRDYAPDSMHNRSYSGVVVPGHRPKMGNWRPGWLWMVTESNRFEFHDLQSARFGRDWISVTRNDRSHRCRKSLPPLGR